MQNVGSRRAERREPLAWLEALESDDAAFPNLVRESGGLAFAAWRLASARLRVRGDVGIPSQLELMSAAVEISERVGWHEPPPTAEALEEACALGGLVLRH